MKGNMISLLTRRKKNKILQSTTKTLILAILYVLEILLPKLYSLKFDCASSKKLNYQTQYRLTNFPIFKEVSFVIQINQRYNLYDA